MTYNFGNGQSYSYTEVTDEEAKGIGAFLFFVGIFLFIAAMVSQTELTGGWLPTDVNPFKHAPMLFGAYILPPGLFFAAWVVVSAGRAIIPIILFIVGVSWGSETATALEWTGFTDSGFETFQVLATFLVPFALAYACLYPYPFWPVLMFSFLWISTALVFLPVSWLNPSHKDLLGVPSDAFIVYGTGVVGIVSMLCAGFYRALYANQQDIASSWFIQHGD